MANNEVPPKSADTSKLPSWLVVSLIVVALGFAWWKNSQSPKVSNDKAADVAVKPESKIEKKTDLSLSEPQPKVISDHQSEESSPSHRSTPTAPEVIHPPIAKPKSHVEPKQAATEEGDGSSYKIENQSIRDLNGRVVFKGTIDLKPTIDRIDRGESNRHRNDGTTFQNREGRLPRKANGYYKEYVHPTSGENGPGPQRVIFGEDGEIWYTPDHYKSFKQIRSKKA